MDAKRSGPAIILTNYVQCARYDFLIQYSVFLERRGLAPGWKTRCFSVPDVPIRIELWDFDVRGGDNSLAWQSFVLRAFLSLPFDADLGRAMGIVKERDAPATECDKTLTYF